jgi:hypothetical protein
MRSPSLARAIVSKKTTVKASRAIKDIPPDNPGSPPEVPRIPADLLDRLAAVDFDEMSDRWPPVFQRAVGPRFLHFGGGMEWNFFATFYVSKHPGIACGVEEEIDEDSCGLQDLL